MSADEPQPGHSYMQETRRTMFLIFAASTVAGIALAWAVVPESAGLASWKVGLGGAMLGFHSAMYPFANRMLAVPD